MIRIQPQYAQRSQWEALAQRENLAYEALELSVPPLLDGDDLAPCRDWYRSTGRTRSLHGCFIDVNPASGDPAFRALSQKRCRESCELALALGAEYVVFHSSAFPFLRGAYLSHWAGVCAGFYTELAEAYGLTICVENSMDVDPEPLCALFREISTAQVRVCLDIGHASYSRFPLERWFDELGESIGYLHLSDNNGQFDEHLPLGEGSVNWALADKAWRQLAPGIPMTLEVGDISGVEQSLTYLKQRGLFGLGGGRV